MHPYLYRKSVNRRQHFSFVLTVYLCLVSVWWPRSVQAQEPALRPFSFYHPEDSSAVFALVREGLPYLEQEPEQAMACFRKAAQISRLSGFYDGIGYATAFMGMAASEMGDYDQSQAYYEEALPYCIHARDCKFVIAYLYMNMAITAKQRGDYSAANASFHRALATFQKYLPHSRSITAVYINLIGIQARMGSYEKALAYAGQAVERAQKDSTQHYLALSLLNKATTFETMERYDSALHYYHTGLETAKALGNKSLYVSYYLGMGNIALKQGRYHKAAGYLEGAIAMDKTAPAGTLFGYILPRYSLGAVYYRLKAYGKAEQVLLEALTKAKATGLTENMDNGHGVLADVYEATGRYKDAVYHANIRQHLKDSTNELEKIRAINDIEIKYQTAEKDKDIYQKQMLIARQEKTIFRKNMTLTGITAGTLLVCVSGIFFYNNRRRIHKRNAEIARLKAAAAGEEQERARISRELHDGVGGMLTGIKLNLRSLQKQSDTSVLPEKLEGIMSMLQDMGEEIRHTAHNLMPDALLKHNLREALTLYCKSLHTEQQQLNLHYHAAPALQDKTLELSVYRIVQELIQNILKHAGASLAEIQISQVKDTLYITAEDNGSGFDPGQDSGIGLQNIKTRVYALNGQYTLTSSPGKGSTTFIELHLKSGT